MAHKEHANKPAGGGHGAGHDAHGHDAAHPKHLAHHFDTPQQQMDSEKFGMWLFLVTEILLFGGLFCAYSWYRGNHPEVFMYAHQLLDVKMGMINTLVLIFSSFTMAWAVRCAQLGQRKLMLGLMFVTILCAFAFMVVKGFEYTSKFEHGAVWSKSPSYSPEKIEHSVAELQGAHGGGHGDAAAPDAAGEHGTTDAHGDAALHPEPATEVAAAAVTTPVSLPLDSTGLVIPQYRKGVWLTDVSNTKPAPEGPQGLTYLPGSKQKHADPEHEAEKTIRPPNTHIFFGIYFAMTGLHGIHVLIGIIAISLLMFYGARGVYTPEYNTPVDLVGLYWHIVDMIWIFLFPLLYLIH